MGFPVAMRCRTVNTYAGADAIYLGIVYRGHGSFLMLVGREGRVFRTFGDGGLAGRIRAAGQARLMWAEVGIEPGRGMDTPGGAGILALDCSPALLHHHVASP